MSENESIETPGEEPVSAHEIEPGAEAMQATVKSPDEAPALATEPGDEAPPAAAKRRVSTGTLFTTAIVLGVLGGVGTGYAIQYSRPATPLAPLTGTRPAYAPAGVYQGVAPAMLPASQDDAAVTDGNLTKLLLPVPAGVSTANAAFVGQLMDVKSAALNCDDEIGCFSSDYQDGVTAIADTGWRTKDGLDVEVRIDRFAAGDSDNARSWVSDGGTGDASIPLPTGIRATGYEFADKFGAKTDYAIAVHGDLDVQIWVVGSPSKTPDPSVIDGLMTKQMGRL